MPILTLTNHVIATGLICPEGKARVELCDTELPGLYVLVSASNPGHGTYFLRYKDHSKKTCHEKIGRTSEISLMDARKKAKALKAQIALGADPRGEEKARKEILTFSEAFEQYAIYAKPRKRSFDRDFEMFHLRIKERFGGKRLDQISRQSISLFHSDLLAQGLAPATCNHYLKLMRRCYSLFCEWNLTNTNPLSKIQLFPENNQIENYLNEEQLQRLLAILATDENRTVCQIATLLLASGCRLNEILSARWQDLSTQDRYLRIAATNSKSKRVRMVPLNDSAMAVIAQLDTRDKYEYLFVNHRTGQRYTTIMKVWSRLRAKAGLPHLRIHDLRHSYASFLANSGRTLLEIQQCLGHADPKVTLRYSHLTNHTLRQASNAADAAIKSAMPTLA